MHVSVQVHRNIYTLIQDTFNRYKTNTQIPNSVLSRGWHMRSTYLRHWCECHLHWSCGRSMSNTCISLLVTKFSDILFGNRIKMPNEKVMFDSYLLRTREDTFHYFHGASVFVFLILIWNPIRSCCWLGVGNIQLLWPFLVPTGISRGSKVSSS